ncbi:MAG: hypothetical protein JST16_01800 [Bdellovibrionales bacterium]|nr:hypothetical protein [Bdellovibrionales bacterium]
MVGFMKSALNLLGIKKTSEGAAGGLDDFLNALPEKMGYSIHFTKTDKDGSGLHYEIEGDEVDSFVSNSSEVLDALSHLAMRVQRKTEGISNEPVADETKESFRISFDAGGFRERKAQELRDMAADKRQKVMESGGKPSYIPALSPSDRKIIHTHLADLGDVVSESIGKGNFKRIRIRMKDDTRVHSDSEGGEQRAHGNGGGGRGPRRNGNGGHGGGRGNGGGRGRRGGGGNGNGQRQRFNANGTEIDGNRIAPIAEDVVLDENIGNRLRPGEDSPFQYGKNDFGHGQNSD